jgi:hypothetical protein
LKNYDFKGFFMEKKNDPDLPKFEEIKFQIARFLMISSIR